MIIVAADHYGFEVKEVVMQWLSQRGLKYEALGSVSARDQQSIADFIPTVCQRVLSAAANRGIMICGTGIGVSIGANRFKGIRAVLAVTPQLAEWSRGYDDANVLCLAGWNAAREAVQQILTVWFDTAFGDEDGSKRAFLTAMDRWS